jgi:succinoglycan biosynthesis protein ExoM
MISICIPTYKRPQQLQTLLRVLLTEVERPEPIEIVICDNDAEHSAEAVVNAASRIADVPMRYYNEPVQNISIARNRTVAEAHGEWIAFIDDDEIPMPTWLSLLAATARNYNADGVFGPVRPVLPDEAPEWIRRGRFFVIAHLRTGLALKATETAAGNAIIKSHVLRQVAGPFDPRYGRSGGEDTLLFSKLLQQYHARFLGCQEAEVKEIVSLARCSLSWLARRAFRGGLIWSKIEAELSGSSMLKFARSAYSLVALLVLAPLALLCLPFVSMGTAKLLLYTSARFGQVCSALPVNYVEYG